MKVLVIGGGGREHALAWKLAQSPRVTKLYAAPGNAGIAQVAECRPVGAEDLPGLHALAQEVKPDLTVVGPDNPLAMGVVDLFQKHGLRIFGPSASAARFESSKIFAKQFMARHGIPTARFGQFSDSRSAEAFARSFGGPCVVKADGLALGKGVLVCQTPTEAAQAIRLMMEQKAFGAAGERVVIEEFMTGDEISIHALVDGRSFRAFPSSQDHKRVGDGDTGPNTGGMGTISPVPQATAELLQTVERQILEPFVRGCQADGIEYRGLIYPGLMLTPDGPRVLEFNARFGDPETQVLMMRMESDLLEAVEAVVDGRLADTALRFRSEAAVCVVMASGGYPGDYPKGKVIRGLDDAAKLDGVQVFHAGTKRQDGAIVTSGGRVLGVTALGRDLKAARERAYEAVARIQFDGAHCRKDIGWRAFRFMENK
ncbi:MAG: phosphoribosylamine--glycine ligase [Verrucomicrobiae bacterium]|nr:phosphoribosylamine--glycine ligase [Verrucomicrobiae bacterium]